MSADPGDRPREQTAVQALQEQSHDSGHDYEFGSPHLKHSRLRLDILGRIRELVQEQLDRAGRCRVLEVGAGHGAFTDHVLAMGACVVVTEMSRPSVEVLRTRYGHNSKAEIVFDPDGTAAARVSDVDLVLAVSVLHHIPDYLAFVRGVTPQINAGGAFASFQDPTWYPRRTSASLRTERALHLAWRVRQGNLREGLRTQARRLRGELDETLAADMTEYHVVRQGVDESALCATLERSFGDVQLWRYFSAQGRWTQALGERILRPQTFGILARDRRE